jgi:hypothetical protein
MKKEYSVVFHYSVRVHAEDEETAENMAWKEFGQSDPTHMDEFTYTIEEMESVWAKTDMGNYTCVDCEDPVSEEEVLGNREHGEPRCEGCYEDYRRA